MALRKNIIVLKFGSSVLRTVGDLPNAVHEIYRWYRAGERVIAVVSAIGLTTDELLCEARGLSATPEPFATAELLATGERASAALLGMLLDRSGIPARVLNPREIELIAAGSPLDSELVSLNVARVEALLLQYPVLVVPGFFGTDTAGRTHILGRGGSDLTAVFIAHALGAVRCRLIKDVDGVYESDPALSQAGHEPRPRRFVSLEYSDALRVAGQLIQPKAVSFLQFHRARVEVARCAGESETLVDAHPTRLEGARSSSEPSRVLLLGLGTVGFGVYERLLAYPEHFRVVGMLVRDRGKYERLGVPTGLLRTRIDQITRLRADIVIDALPDPEVARPIAEHFLAAGAAFVSAGKALIAEFGVYTAELAQRRGGTLSYSAAVGGAAPMLETVESAKTNGSIVALTGVLNGTCNFILNRCGEGETLGQAISEAQRAGFAEAESHDDLSGQDAARKIRILSRVAFGREARLTEVQTRDDSTAARAREVVAHDLRLRQIARAAACGGDVLATVRFEALPAQSPLGRLRDAWNALQVLSQDGELQVVTGRGAGRWPTVESMMADIFEARRQQLTQTPCSKIAQGACLGSLEEGPLSSPQPS
jgi:homoserine dehydrogenase